MTSGQILKDKLGLKNLRYIRIARILITTYKVYMIWIDTRYPNTPLTAGRILKSPIPSMLYQYPFNSRPNIGPLFDLVDYNGDIQSGMFFLVDISGYLGIPSNRSKILESKESKLNFIYAKNLNILCEGLQVRDLQKNAISDRNKKFLNLRKKNGDAEINLNDVKWYQNSDEIEIIFFAHPTYSNSALNIDPKLNKYIDSKYTLIIRFEDVSRFLGNKETFLGFTPSEQGKLILELLNNAECRLYSSDPSWFYQGSYEIMDKLGASVYSYTGPEQTGIWAERHKSDIHLNKHWAQALSLLFTNYSDISKNLKNNN